MPGSAPNGKAQPGLLKAVGALPGSEGQTALAAAACGQCRTPGGHSLSNGLRAPRAPRFSTCVYTIVVLTSA